MDRIDDFGEVIPGAAKHRHHANKWREDIAQAGSQFGAGSRPQTLVEIWPAPNWQRLLDEGCDPAGVAAARSLRDLYPPKSGSRYEPQVLRDAWTRGARELAALSSRMVVYGPDALAWETEHAITDLLDTNSQWFHHTDVHRTGTHLLQWRHHSQLYVHAGHKKSFAKIVLTQKLAGARDHMPGIYQTVRQDLRDGSPFNMRYGRASRTVGDSDYPTIQDAAEDWLRKCDRWTKRSPRTKNWENQVDFYRSGNYHGSPIEPCFFIAKKARGKGASIIPMFLFKQKKAMWDWWRENKEAVCEKLESLSNVPAHRQGAGEKRIGPDHRSSDTTQEEIEQVFSPRGVQFGNSMPQKERADHMSCSYDALMDMSLVTGIPADKLMLDNQLALAFGARGHGGRGAGVAHYEPVQRVINLTRNRGAGSLAHEWWHALDNHCAFENSYATDSIRSNPTSVTAGFGDAFKELVTAMENSPYKERCVRMNQVKKRSGRLKDYWRSDREMSARAFEAVVHNRLEKAGLLNEYLVQYTPYEQWAPYDAPTMMEAPCDPDFDFTQRSYSSYPYPMDDEIEALDKAFTRVIEDTLGVEMPPLDQLQEIAQALREDRAHVEEVVHGRTVAERKPNVEFPDPAIIGEYTGQGDMMAHIGFAR